MLGKSALIHCKPALILLGKSYFYACIYITSEIEAENEEMAKGWPKKVKHELHEHELELIHRPEYGCDGCKEGGAVWSFYCDECDFDLHPKCALEENKGTKGDREDDMEEGTKTKEGYVCDGDVCRKA
ncbi:hypothetical protein C3L33_21980, partial [Rhododendron williamsianum]